MVRISLLDSLSISSRGIDASLESNVAQLVQHIVQSLYKQARCLSVIETGVWGDRMTKLLHICINCAQLLYLSTISEHTVCASWDYLYFGKSRTSLPLKETFRRRHISVLR